MERKTKLVDQATTFKLSGPYSGMAIQTVYEYFLWYSNLPTSEQKTNKLLLGTLITMGEKITNHGTLLN